ncbi:hypothetical protein LEP1GSC161_0336 [Leptospira santarosai str. CBC1416]|uniref:Uncharacterized protein n=1 Tax=Leptospira santarosai str. CBC1416 TaxID=1193059 RepID=M6W7P2_9LEPT|nr:hypothetical protein LEP1GSC161_0336 [Leptospira santarosai str. CBC1416]
MRIGLVTIKEADDFLQFYAGAERWRDVDRDSFVLPGKVVATGMELIGIDTDFTDTISGLITGDTLDIDYQIVAVTSVVDSSHATIYPLEFDLIEPVRFRKIPTANIDTLKKLYQRKRESLFTANERLLASTAFSYNSVSEETLKKAQIIFALEIFRKHRDIHTENRANGVASYSIADMSYTYTTGAQMDIPESVFNILKKEGALRCVSLQRR